MNPRDLLLGKVDDDDLTSLVVREVRHVVDSNGSPKVVSRLTESNLKALTALRVGNAERAAPRIMGEDDVVTVAFGEDVATKC